MFYWGGKKSKRLSFKEARCFYAVSFSFFFPCSFLPSTIYPFSNVPQARAKMPANRFHGFFVDSSSRTLDRYSSTLQDAQAVHFAVHFADHHSGYARIRTTYSRHECKTLVSACPPLSTPREQMIRMDTFREKGLKY